MTMQAQGNRITLFSALAADNGAPSEGAVATETLTLIANAADGEAVTIRNTVYTWKTALTTDPRQVPYEVLIGASASISLDNLIAAVNDTGTEGTDYSRTATHPDIYAAAGAGDTMDITAKTVGTVANAYATTETMANGSWGGATMSGGTARDGIELHAGISSARLPRGFDPKSMLADGKLPSRWALEILATATGALEFDPYFWGYEDAGSYGDDGVYARLGSGANIGHVSGGVRVTGTDRIAFRDHLVNLGHLSWVYLEVLNRSGTSFSAGATLTPVYEEKRKS